MRSCLEWKDTMVPNEFVDRFMAAANGEYVKVYLYVLRHQGRVGDVGRIADDLNHTEADIKRALNYWVKQGVLAPEGLMTGEMAGGGSGKGGQGVRQEPAREGLPGGTAGECLDHRGETPGETMAGRDVRNASAPVPGVSFEPLTEAEAPFGIERESPSGCAAGTSAKPAAKDSMGASVGSGMSGTSVRTGSGMSGTSMGTGAGMSGTSMGTGSGMSGTSVCSGSGMAGTTACSGSGVAAASGVRTSPGTAARTQAVPRKTYTPEQVSQLADQEDFTQLLYISQKYMNKVFTPRECEVFAYLYDSLRMSPDLLEYLVEYCVQGGHYSFRYLESVALNWHENGIRTVDKAKEHTAAFNKDGFAVMKAFGINDRRPGEAEQEMICKWFREFGFTRDIVLEACSRTLKAIHKPSFSYADKILSEWKKGGVRILADVEKMDERRESRRTEKTAVAAKPGKNQFHNFEQRNTDYDAMVLERLKERLGEH